MRKMMNLICSGLLKGLEQRGSGCRRMRAAAAFRFLAALQAAQNELGGPGPWAGMLAQNELCSGFENRNGDRLGVGSNPGQKDRQRSRRGGLEVCITTWPGAKIVIANDGFGKDRYFLKKYRHRFGTCSLWGELARTGNATFSAQLLRLGRQPLHSYWYTEAGSFRERVHHIGL